MTGGDDEKKVSTLPKRQHNSIVRSDKSVTIKDCTRRFVLLKLTTDRPEASRGLFATAELLVLIDNSNSNNSDL